MNTNIWYAVMMDRQDTDWGTGSADLVEAKRMVIKNLDIYPAGYIAVIDGDVCTGEILPEEFGGVIIGKWSGTDIDIVWVEGGMYALNGWNGEKYTECWRCLDRFTADPEGGVYEIAPVYDWSIYDEDAGAFLNADGNIVDGVIGYEIL